MENLYDGLPASKAFLEYVLNILSDCLIPQTFEQAASGFDKLEGMLKAENAAPQYYEAVQQARVKFDELRQLGAEPFTKAYNAPLTVMRDVLLEAAYKFEEECS